MYRYDRNTVVMTYRAAHPDKHEPSEAVLTEFDTDLFDRYDEEIVKQAGENGIPTDRRNRSLLAFLADQSTARKVETRVRHACKYYNAVRPHFQEAEPGGGSTGGNGSTDG